MTCTHSHDLDGQATGSLSAAVERGDVLSADCASRAVLRRVTNRWGVIVLLALSTETYRFSELRRRASGISERMLSKTLQDLEADGFVHREARPVVPPHVEYSLTPLGRGLVPHVATLADWIESNIGHVLTAQRRRGPAYDRP